MISHKLMTAGIVLGLGLIFITAAWLPIHGDIFFHTDIARDFWLLDEVVQTGKPTLIGPRAGGIPGVFHGPAWLYLNLPVFILFGGNPLALGWFWVGLFGLSLIGYHWVSQKMLGFKPAIWATLLLGTILAPAVPNSFNPIGAVLLTPFWFYGLYRYHQSKSFLPLGLSFLVLGLIGQFEIAFALPIWILAAGWVGYQAIKQKRWVHVTAAFGFFVPLSTHWLFELRHQFLQTRALAEFLKGTDGGEKYQLISILKQRLAAMVTVGHGLLPKNLGAGLVLLLGLTMAIPKYRKLISQNSFVFMIGYFYLGFWMIMILFKGSVWSYYYWPFLPLMVWALVSLAKTINAKWLWLILAGVYLINLLGLARWITGMNRWIGQDPGSWQFHLNLATRTASENPEDFGYFVYTPDQYGYESRYAMAYLDQTLLDRELAASVKKPTTILILAPDSPGNPYTSAGYWAKEKVRILAAPIHEVVYANGYRVVTYKLNQTEIDTGTDPTLIKDNYFR